MYYDDEMEDTMVMEFNNIEDIIGEIDGIYDSLDDAIREGGVEIISDGYVITNKFKKLTNSEHIDLIVAIYCQETGYNTDGLWWSDKLDILKYSAPRGVIFDSKIDSWDISKQ